jgi:hypothetical protein
MSVIEMAKNGWHRWRVFRELEPGHRFQTRYHNHRERRERGETSRYGRLLNLVGGPILIVAGIAFLPTPGPSYIIIVVGLWMLAGELLSLARFLDRAEVGLRRGGRWIGNLWTGASLAARALAVAAIPACIGALAYWLFWS